MKEDENATYARRESVFAVNFVFLSENWVLSRVGISGLEMSQTVFSLFDEIMNSPIADSERFFESLKMSCSSFKIDRLQRVFSTQ